MRQRGQMTRLKAVIPGPLFGEACFGRSWEPAGIWTHTLEISVPGWICSNLVCPPLWNTSLPSLPFEIIFPGRIWLPLPPASEQILLWPAGCVFGQITCPLWAFFFSHLRQEWDAMSFIHRAWTEAAMKCWVRGGSSEMPLCWPSLHQQSCLTCRVSLWLSDSRELNACLFGWVPARLILTSSSPLSHHQEAQDECDVISKHSQSWIMGVALFALEINATTPAGLLWTRWRTPSPGRLLGVMTCLWRDPSISG